MAILLNTLPSVPGAVLVHSRYAPNSTGPQNGIHLAAENGVLLLFFLLCSTQHTVGPRKTCWIEQKVTAKDLNVVLHGYKGNKKEAWILLTGAGQSSRPWERHT